MNFLKCFVPAFFLPLILDFVWLTLITKPFYVDKLSRIGRIEDGNLKPIVWPVIIVYLLIAFGITHFVMPKAIDENTLACAFTGGAFLGLVIYGVYDFTNYATLKDYPLVLSFVDLAWGTVLCGIVAMLTLVVNRMTG